MFGLGVAMLEFMMSVVEKCEMLWRSPGPRRCARPIRVQTAKGEVTVTLRLPT